MLERLLVAEEWKSGLDEVRRICALPVEAELTPEEVEAVSAAELTPAAWASGFRLWRQQAAVALAYDSCGGVFAPIPVGGGKAASTYLVAKHGWARGRQKILLIVPSELVGKSLTKDVPFARRVIGLTTPVHNLAAPPAKRLAMCRSGWRGIYVYPMSLMSRPSAEEELGLLAPDLVIVDEAHALRYPRAATVKRFVRLMHTTKAQFAAFSGTMARRSLMDYWHLILLALGENCPLPRQKAEVDFWASCIDSVGREWEVENQEENQSSLEPLREWTIERVRRSQVRAVDVGGPLTPNSQGYRRAFKIRRDTCPGVVASSETALGASLRVLPAPVPTPASNEAVDAMIARLEDEITGAEPWVPSATFRDYSPYLKLRALMWAIERRNTTPNGDVVAYKIHNHRWFTEMTAGFYNELVWPTVSALAQSRGIPEVEAYDLLERAKDQWREQRAYAKELRLFLDSEHVQGLDTDMLVGGGCARRDVRLPTSLVSQWHVARDMCFEGMPTRVSNVVRVCDYKIRAALEWAQALPEDQGALVWVENIEVGLWAAEVFRAALGDRFEHCPAGETHNKRIQEPSIARKIVVASIKGHHRGKDLPHFARSYLLQCPRSASIMEQLIGRTHRVGQEADEVEVWTCFSNPFDHQNFNALLFDAVFLAQAEGPQKIMQADYAEQPRLYPAEYLSQRGFDLLSREGDADAILRAVLGAGQ